VSIVIIYFICILYPAFPFKLVVYVIYFSCIDVKTNQSLELLMSDYDRPNVGFLQNPKNANMERDNFDITKDLTISHQRLDMKQQQPGTSHPQLQFI
jgi:hypothetical protein